jgi:hypothetical protein
VVDIIVHDGFKAVGVFDDQFRYFKTLPGRVLILFQLLDEILARQLSAPPFQLACQSQYLRRHSFALSFALGHSAIPVWVYCFHWKEQALL